MPDTSTSCGTSLIIRLCDNDSLAWNQLVELYGASKKEHRHSLLSSHQETAKVMENLKSFRATATDTQRNRIDRILKLISGPNPKKKPEPQPDP